MASGKERLSTTMKKNIQISYELFLNIAKYFTIKENENYKRELEEIIVKEINEKLDKLVLHDIYTKSKQAPTDEERKKAKEEYLTQKGIHKDFQYQKK